MLAVGPHVGVVGRLAVALRWVGAPRGRGGRHERGAIERGGTRSCARVDRSPCSLPRGASFGALLVAALARPAAALRPRMQLSRRRMHPRELAAAARSSFIAGVAPALAAGWRRVLGRLLLPGLCCWLSCSSWHPRRRGARARVRVSRGCLSRSLRAQGSSLLQHSSLLAGLACWCSIMGRAMSSSMEASSAARAARAAARAPGSTSACACVSRGSMLAGQSGRSVGPAGAAKRQART